MNRNLLIAIAAIIVIGGGYYLMTPRDMGTVPATTPAADTTTTAPATTAPAADTTAPATTAPATTAPAADATATPMASADMAAVLTPATWDAVKVNAMIAGSTLDTATKATLTGLVDAAGTDSVKIGEAITAIKKAMQI